MVYNFVIIIITFYDFLDASQGIFYSILKFMHTHIRLEQHRIIRKMEYTMWVSNKHPSILAIAAVGEEHKRDREKEETCQSLH
jgi:hypothetical protein